MKGFLISACVLFGLLFFKVTAQTNEGMQPVQTCMASFHAVTDSIDPLLVNFFDQSSGLIKSYYWVFGDPASGGSNTSTVKDPVHIFSGPGTYIVCLTVANNDTGSLFCVDDTCVAVTVHENVECQADFYVTFDTLFPELHIVWFHDNSLGKPNHWNWNFGDDSTDNQQNPLHAYAETGTYKVCLTIRHEVGGDFCTDSICKDITITKYLNLGGHLFAGPYPINNPVNTGDTGIVYLFSFFGSVPVLVDSNYFYYLGYYTFPHVAEGNYYVRATLTKGSAHHDQYLPTYYGDVTEFYQATMIHLSDSDIFNATIHMKSINPGIGENGPVSGRMAGNIYPNPCNGNAFTDIVTDKKEAIRITVYSVTGETIFTRVYFLYPGQNQLTIPAESFSEGIFFMTSVLQDGTVLRSWKLLKFH